MIRDGKDITEIKAYKLSANACYKCGVEEKVAGQSLCESCRKAYDEAHKQKAYKLRLDKRYKDNPANRCPRCVSKVLTKKDKSEDITAKICKCGEYVQFDEYLISKRIRFISNAEKQKTGMTSNEKREKQEKKEKSDYKAQAPLRRKGLSPDSIKVIVMLKENRNKFVRKVREQNHLVGTSAEVKEELSAINQEIERFMFDHEGEHSYESEKLL